jgi:hypothetical protein
MKAALLLLLAVATCAPAAYAQNVIVRDVVWEGGDAYLDLTWKTALGVEALPQSLTYSLKDGRSDYELQAATVVADVSALGACETPSLGCRSITLAGSVLLVVGRCTVPTRPGASGRPCTLNGECASGACKSERPTEQATVLSLSWTWAGGGLGASQIIIPIRPVGAP